MGVDIDRASVRLEQAGGPVIIKHLIRLFAKFHNISKLISKIIVFLVSR